MALLLPGAAQTLAILHCNNRRCSRLNAQQAERLQTMIKPKTALGAALVACTLLSGIGPVVASPLGSVAKAISGTASWYGNEFHGRKTANGERFNQNGLTAAHRSLPFGTKVRVTNQDNGKSVVVRINDRGPFVGKRVIDLSRGAAQAVGMMDSGTAPVRLEVIGSA